MRALTFTKYGKASEVLRVADVPAPTKADVPEGFVLIKVRAASLNPVDKGEGPAAGLEGLRLLRQPEPIQATPGLCKPKPY